MTMKKKKESGNLLSLSNVQDNLLLDYLKAFKRNGNKVEINWNENVRVLCIN